MIKVFILAAQTADGFIAKDKSHSPFDWTSKEDKDRFVTLSKRAGVVVLGASTFKTFPKPLKDRLNIVYSRSETFEGAETTSLPPAELIKSLEERGFKEVAISGGSQIYTMFLEAGVVDTIYLTIEPILFGTGISVFNKDLDVKLELVSEEKTEGGTLMLEYKILNKLV
ncbi:MAG: dihydrofolate reductase family protein [Patescibacteria group bacterium]